MWKVIGVAIIVSAIALTLYLPLSSPKGIFNTPDENANYFFAMQIRERGELRRAEPFAQLTDNAVHPRGVNIIHGHLVPESFLGVPILYGVTRLVSQDVWLSTVLVVALTLFALYALYQLFLHFFDKQTARLALLFVCTLPVFLYWIGRPYMHTILFLDFLILGWLLLDTGRLSLRASEGSASKYRWDIVAGILIGLALAMRTSEAFWVIVGTLVLWYGAAFRGETHTWAKSLLLLLKIAFGTTLILVPILFLNQDLYGNFFGTGYSVSETNLVVQDAEVPQLAHVSIVHQLLIPFGLYPVEALRRFVTYALGGMWWYVVPMILGVLIGWRSWYTRVWITISLYLIFVYGSFRAEVFADPMHPLSATIGAPYLRYWLPIFVFGAPLAAQFFVWLRSMLPTKFYILHFTFYIGAVILLVFLSLRAVLWHGPESWYGIQENLWQFAEARERTIRATNNDAVFIVPHWADRIYFPVRKVIVDVEGKNMIEIVRTLRSTGVQLFWHRGRGEIMLEPDIYAAGFTLKRRFDVDPKGKVYEIID